MSLAIVGAVSFGLLIGWVTYRTLYHMGERVAVSAIASAGGAIGGAALSGSFGGREFFAFYSIGLAGGFFLCVILGHIMLRKRVNDAWLGSLSKTVSDDSVFQSVPSSAASVDYRNVLGYVGDWVRKRKAKPNAGVAIPERGDNVVASASYDALKEIIIPEWQDQRTPEEETETHDRELRSVKPSRYANAVLFDPTSGKTLSPQLPLEPSQVFRLRLDIGPLSSESQVTPSEPGKAIPPFPDKKVPEDVNLGVMVSSTDFAVGLDAKQVAEERGKIAHGNFFLPGDGSPATTPPGGGHYLNFFLLAPNQPGHARSRIGYYYRNILVQSQLLAAYVGTGGGFEIKTDFTLSDDLTNLADFPERPRISVLTNANGNGTHQIVLRKQGTQPTDGAQGESFYVSSDNIGRTINSLRAALRDRSPTTRHRRRAELQEDLAQFAPKGWSLWTQVPGQHPGMFRPLLQDPASYVVQVVRPTTSGFVFPWSLIYDIPLSSGKPSICKLVTTWDETRPLVAAGQRDCPYGPHKEEVLCPFGFWGFRYSIDQLSSTKDSVFIISAPDKWNFVVAETQFQINIEALSDHIGELKKSIKRGFPGASLIEGKDKGTIRGLLGSDLPVVYFYCHGQKTNDIDPNTYLGVGKNESIMATELQGWVQSWLKESKVIWDKLRPLVFVNACHSLEIHPETLVSYLDAFVGTARAAGVIGTEVRVNQDLAMKVAERFFDLLLGQPQPVNVDQALRTIRLEYLADGNLLGLFYTSYCWAELSVTRQSALVTQH
jgi:hypothetical protein